MFCRLLAVLGRRNVHVHERLSLIGHDTFRVIAGSLGNLEEFLKAHSSFSPSDWWLAFSIIRLDGACHQRDFYTFPPYALNASLSASLGPRSRMFARKSSALIHRKP